MEDGTISILGYSLMVPLYAKQMFLAAMFGFLIGLEREWKQKVASIRTFAIISVGSCLFTSLSTGAAGGSIDGMPYDVTRVAAGIVTGIGFLGGGVIFKSANRIEGITTGAMIWFAAGLGMACGFNEPRFALWAFIVHLAIFIASKPIYDIVELSRDEIVADYRAAKAMRKKKIRRARNIQRKAEKEAPVENA